MPRNHDNLATYRQRIGSHQNQVNENPISSRRHRNIKPSEITKKQLLGMLLLTLLISADVVSAQQFIMTNSLSEKQKLNCDRMKKNIGSLEKKFEHIEQAISLGGDDFIISCVDEENKTNKVANMNVFFNAGTDTLQLDAAHVAPDELISHEFLHARSFFANRKCGVRRGLATIPAHPVNPVELSKLNKAFDAGDKRISEFQALTIKQETRVQLSKQEMEKLRIYNDACRGIIVTKVKLFLGQEEYEFARSGLKKSVPYPVHADAFGGKFNLYEAGFDAASKKYYIIGTPIERKTAAVLVPQIVKANLAAYSKKTPEERIAEREAYTFQSLPRAAQEVFYTEAYLLREQNIAECERYSSKRVEL